MALPFFYNEEISPGVKQYLLNEETSKHIVQVLRMKTGEKLNITNGKGYLFTTVIAEGFKNKVLVNILDTNFSEPAVKKISIAISLVKNAARFEWFIEKVTELGIAAITPLICKRTEKQKFREDRLKNIMISAMLQSQQTWLPVLQELQKFEEFISKQNGPENFIAHCEDEQNKQPLFSFHPFKNPLILIGPEGDFTHDEIMLALNHNFKGVALGNTRLRTETAGIVAVTLFNQY